MFTERKKKRKKKGTQSSLIITSAFLLTLGFVSIPVFFMVKADSARANQNVPLEMKLEANIGVKPYVVEFFTDNDAEEMIPIIRCESQFKHFGKDGEVLKNSAGSSAIGIAQIMSSVHPDPKVLYKYNKRNNTDLTAADFDINTLLGNLGYALVLYKVRGTRDWECAKKI